MNEATSAPRRRAGSDDVAGDVSLETTNVLDDHTEDGLALALVGTHPHLRWVNVWGRWYCWDGQCWRQDSTLTVYERIRALCRATAKEWRTQDAAVLRKATTVAAIEKLSRSDARYAATTDQWDRDPCLLNTPAGVLNLRTGENRGHVPEAYMTKTTAVASEGECPQWLAFLSDVTEGDDDYVEFLRRLAGYCLTGYTDEHVLAFLYGAGANGKGTFLNTLTGVFGDYAAVAPMDTFTETKSDRHPTDLAMLRGARMVVAQETELGRRWSESRIKHLTGGDPITARFMNKDFFTYQPNFTLMMAGNHKPRLTIVDEAMRRRILMLPFTVRVPAERRDPRLAEKLKAEWSGILAWVVEGAHQYFADGLKPPAKVLDATRNYFSAEDTFAVWLEDCCDTAPARRTAPAVLFECWNGWCSARGYEPGNPKTFAADLESHGFESGRNGKHGRFWKGIAPLNGEPSCSR